MNRSTGYRPDREDSRDWPARALVAAFSRARAAVGGPSLLELRTRAWDAGKRYYQNGVGRCVSTAVLGHCVDLSYAVVGVDIPLLSAAHLYHNGVRYGLAQDYPERAPEDLPKLTPEDFRVVGMRPRDAFISAREQGIVLDTVWPSATVAPHQEPPPEVQVQGYDLKGLAAYRIYETGEKRWDVVRRLTMEYKVPVIYAQRVDGAFGDYKGGVVDGVDPASESWHMMGFLDFPNDRETRVNNWWEGTRADGTKDEWGDDRGTGLVSKKVITNSLHIGDVWAIQAPPALLLTTSSIQCR